MGIFKAIFGSTSGVLADQWKEFFYCDALGGDIIGMRGRKRVSERSSNTKSDDNVITDGSLIVVADGQIAIAVERGKAFACWMEPGEYQFSSKASSSIMNGGGVGGILSQIVDRVGFGGEVPMTQRIYYFSTLESGAVEFETKGAIPFRAKDKNVGLDLDAGVNCSGSFTYRLTDAVKFYNTVCGNFSDTYTRKRLKSQLQSEVLTSLQSALGQLAEEGMRVSELPAHTEELCEILKKDWKEHRGLEIVSIGIQVSVEASDAAMIKELQHSGALRDPSMAAAHLVGAQGAAMQAAAENESGGAVGMMGMMSAMNQTSGPGTPQMPPARWICSCGQLNQGNFCENCGKKRPEK